MIGQWARLFTQLTTFRTMTCFGESNGSAVQHERSKRSPNGCLHGTAARRRNESAECEIALLSNKENRKNRRGPIEEKTRNGIHWGNMSHIGFALARI